MVRQEERKKPYLSEIGVTIATSTFANKTRKRAIIYQLWSFVVFDIAGDFFLHLNAMREREFFTS